MKFDNSGVPHHFCKLLCKSNIMYQIFKYPFFMSMCFLKILQKSQIQRKSTQTLKNKTEKLNEVSNFTMID